MTTGDGKSFTKEHLFRFIESQLLYIESSYDSIVAHNQSLTLTAAKPIDREEILTLWKSKGYDCLDNKFHTDNRKIILKYKLIDLIGGLQE